MQDKPDNNDNNINNESPPREGSHPPMDEDTVIIPLLPEDKRTTRESEPSRPTTPPRPAPYTGHRSRRPIPRGEQPLRPSGETGPRPRTRETTRSTAPEGYPRRRPSGRPINQSEEFDKIEQIDRFEQPRQPIERTRRPLNTETRPPRHSSDDYPPRRKPAHKPISGFMEEPEITEEAPISRTKRPKRRARRRTQFAALYIFIIVISAGIGMTAFAAAFPRMFDSDRETTSRFAATPTPAPTPTPLPLNTRNLTGLITNVSAQTITMLDISANNTNTFVFTETTDLRNRFGQSMDFEDVTVGNLMDIAYNPDNSELFSLRQTVTRDLTPADFRVDTDYSTITVGNDVFNFNEQTLVLRRGNAFLLEDVRPEYMVTLVTLGDMIWTIDIESAHGFLRFINGDSILDGRVIMNPIGPGINRFGDVTDTITLPEGAYRVTVEGRNIEAYVTEIEIIYGETTIIDLADVEPSEAVLELTVTPGGSRVFINGVLTPAHGALEFEFGETLTIRVERDGFYTEERTVEMNQAIVSINISLEEETPVVVMAMLSITAMPAGAQIFINGQFVGLAPINVEIYPGQISIAAFATGYYDYVTAIEVVPGQNNRSVIMSRIPDEPEYVPIPTLPPEENFPPDDPPYDPPYTGYGEYND